jgi:tetratricopeptide (TPR) repeat protein
MSFERYVASQDVFEQGACSPEELDELSHRFQSASERSDPEEMLRVATRSLLRRHYAQAIEAFETIGREHPDRQGHCANNIGAAQFFLGNYADAIGWYERAKAFGEDSAMLDDNIAEARQKMEHARPSTNAEGTPVRSPAKDLDYAAVLVPVAQSQANKRVLVTGEIPEKKAKNLAAFLPADEPALVALDLTTFKSAKDAVVFTPRSLVAHDMGKTRSLLLRSIEAFDGVQGALEDTVALSLFGGATVHLPCGGHGKLMGELVDQVARLNAQHLE